MISLHDTVLLAATKLRTRRVRLTITVVTMSLLFAGLVFLTTVIAGVITSLHSFNKEGLGNRFIVSAQPMTYQSFSNDALMETLRPQQADLVARKKAMAKKLNLQYDEKTDNSLPITTYQNGPNAGDVQQMVNSVSPIAIAALEKQNSELRGVSYQSFEKLAKAQGAINIFRGTNQNYMGGSPSGSGLSVLVDGKENFTASSTAQTGPPTGLQSITSAGWRQLSPELLQPFLLEGQTAATKDGVVPILAPLSAAEEAVGLKKLPATATNEEKIAHTVELRKRAAGKTAQLCYRNSASQALLQKAVSQRDEIAANKNNKDYTLPHLLYTLPATPCGETTIKSDKRTAEEKKADANQQAFDTAFGGDTTPAQGLITVRIVGLLPDLDFGTGAFSLNTLLSGVLGSTLGFGWVSPTTAFTEGSFAATAQSGTIAKQPLTQQMYFAEFSNLAAAKQFIKQNNCTANSEGGGFNFNPNTSTDRCIKAGTPFIVVPFGNNAGAIDDFQRGFWKISRYAMLVILALASLVMMGTLGKIIADSRRETAVFRSLGAKRLDISQIY